MLYTAYLDESDTHGESPTIIMAGVLGHEQQWVSFNERLQAIHGKHGFNIIHATELKRKKGEFRGWSTEQCLALIKDITEACDQHLATGCVVSIPHTQYREEYRDKPFPKGMKPDSHYGLCFRNCLARLGLLVRMQDSQGVLNIVLEKGHANAGDTERIFDEFKKELSKAGLNNFGTFTTASKGEALPLMIADFFAHSHSIINKEGWDLARFDLLEFRSARQAMHYLHITSEELDQLKHNFQERKEEKMKKWKRNKSRTKSE
jgi:hypothetical protein